MIPDNTRGFGAVYASCTGFLYYEAELLDDNELGEWIGLLDEDLDYQIPVRVTQERASERSFSEKSFHVKENYSTMKARIERLETEYDWSEDPPSRTRRFVSNVRISDMSDDWVDCKSNIFVYRSRGDTTSHDVLTAERHDRLSRTPDGLRLSDRRVLLDQTILDTKNLAIVL